MHIIAAADIHSVRTVYHWLVVSELIFAVKSNEAADQLPLERLERGLRILHAYEKVPQHNLDDKDSVLQQITKVIREYDEGQSEQWEMPF